MRKWSVMLCAGVIAPLLALALLVAAAPAAAAEGNRVVYKVALTGAAEVTKAGVPNQGDPDGRGTATIKINQTTGEICYKLKVNGIEPATAAHIHFAPATTTGPVVTGMSIAAPTDGQSKGCFVDPALAAAIVADPAQYYVNVHNLAFPGGALRGQLAD